MLLPSVGQVQRDKVDDVERHADDAKVLQDEVEQVSQVDREQARGATQDHLHPRNRWGIDKAWNWTRVVGNLRGVEEDVIILLLRSSIRV